MIIGTPREVFFFLKSLKDGSIVKAQEIKETRSQRQNRLYHKWLNDIGKCFEEKGIFITHDELHEGLRDKLIPGSYERNKLTSRRIHKKKSTTQLSKKEFSKYISDCEKYLWREFEIVYPLPTDMFYKTKKIPTNHDKDFS